MSRLSLDLPGSGVPAVDGIRVGIGGWTYAPWRDNFYPGGLVQRRELEMRGEGRGNPRPSLP